MPSTLSLSSSRPSDRPALEWRRPSAWLLALTLLAAMLGFYLQVLHDAMTRAATVQAQMLQQVVTIPPDFVECDLRSLHPVRHGTLCPPPPDRGMPALRRVSFGL